MFNFLTNVSVYFSFHMVHFEIFYIFFKILFFKTKLCVFEAFSIIFGFPEVSLHQLFLWVYLFIYLVLSVSCPKLSLCFSDFEKIKRSIYRQKFPCFGCSEWVGSRVFRWPLCPQEPTRTGACSRLWTWAGSWCGSSLKRCWRGFLRALWPTFTRAKPSISRTLAAAGRSPRPRTASCFHVSSCCDAVLIAHACGFGVRAEGGGALHRTVI